MELITPGIGLLFWMTVSFSLVLIVLRKYAWRPILSNIRIRERVIARSVIQARQVEEELAQLEQTRIDSLRKTEKTIQEMHKHADEEAVEIIAKAKKAAVVEARKIIEEAMKSIEIQKKSAMLEIKDEVASLSVEMAEKVLQEEFSDKSRNTVFVHKLLDKMMLN